jgi:hypothetical protein
MKTNIRSTFRGFWAFALCSLVLGLSACNMLKNLPGLSSLEPPPMSVGGNWQIDLMDANGNVGSVATGFLQQSGSNLTGGFDVNGCTSSSTASGTVGGNSGPNAINLSLSVNSQTLSIVASGVGTVTPGNAIEGNYSVGAISCPISGLTATASGQQINSVTGNFHGSLQSKNGNTFTVAGSATQGQYASGSSAPVTGTATATSSTCFNSLNLTGTISGTSVNWQLASTDGSLVVQLTAPPISAAGQFSTGTPGVYTITALTGTYDVTAGSCSGDTGTFSFTLP